MLLVLLFVYPANNNKHAMKSINRPIPNENSCGFFCYDAETSAAINSTGDAVTISSNRLHCKLVSNNIKDVQAHPRNCSMSVACVPCTKGPSIIVAPKH